MTRGRQYQKVGVRQQLYLDIINNVSERDWHVISLVIILPARYWVFSEQQRSRMELELPSPGAFSDIEGAPFAVAPLHLGVM